MWEVLKGEKNKQRWQVKQYDGLFKSKLVFLIANNWSYSVKNQKVSRDISSTFSVIDK